MVDEAKVDMWITPNHEEMLHMGSHNKGRRQSGKCVNSQLTSECWYYGSPKYV